MLRPPPRAGPALSIGLLLAALAMPAPGQESGPVELFPRDQALPEPPPPSVVAPVPEPTMRVLDLAAPPPDALGGSTRLGPAPWRGSDAALVLTLLPRLPPPPWSGMPAELARDLLLAGSDGLEGEVEPGVLLDLRLRGLRDLGATADLQDLLAALPAAEDDASRARMRAETALLAGDVDAACLVGEAARARFEAPFWLRLDIVCRIRAGDEAAARLGLRLLAEIDADDRAFAPLAEAMLGGGAPAPPVSLPEPDALALVMLELAGLSVPDSALATAEPALLVAIAGHPTTPGPTRRAAAEAAWLAGALLPGDGQAVSPEAEEGDDPPARARLLAASIAAAPAGPERLLLLERAALATLAFNPSPDLAFAAGPFALALLAAGRSRAAATWRALAAGADGRLDALFSLAAPGETGMRQGPLAFPVPDRGLALRLHAALAGLGRSVDPVLWRSLLAGPVEDAGPAPDPALWHALGDAAAAGRVAETVLLALHLMDGRPQEAHPLALGNALSALVEVGLEVEARRLALETLLVAGW